MANKRINKSEAVYDHDCFDNYFYSDPEKENSWALNDLCATIDDCHLEHTGEVDNQDYVECCTTLPDGTEVAVSVGICDDGTGDNDLHELASYNIDVGDNVGPGVIREWNKAYKIDEIPEMWQDLWNDLDKLIAEHSANESLNKGKTMKSESIEDLKDKSVSWGTMRSEDLIPKFLGVLKQYAPDNYDAYVKANPEVLDLKGMDDETLGWVVDELFDELDKIAPEGTYFGAHPDDGADYGFWSVEESKQREAKKSEAYEDIWRGAKVVSYEDASDYITLPAEEEQQIIDKYGEDYYDNPDAMNEYAEALDDYIVSMFDQDFVYIDGDEIPLAVCREPKVLIVQDIDHIDGDKAVELVKKLANGELTGSSEDGDFVAIMDGVNGSPHFDIYSEEPKSEGKSDKDGKDDKDCKGKGCDGSDEKCGGDKKKENRGKPQEGPGAGYDVTFEDVDVKDVSVTFNEAKDAFDVALKISARMNAEGYDWDTQYYREHMGYEPEDDEITLKFSLPNSSLKQDWADMDMADASIEEKVKALDEAFHSVDLRKFGYGGGYSHSKFNPGRVDNVLVYPFEYDGAYIEPCQSNSSLLEYNTYIPLEMDVQGTFAQDVEGACNYSSDLYDYTEKVRDIVKDLLPEQEISDSDISDDRCEDYFTGGWDAEDAANEIADELRDSSESKKSESGLHDAYYAKALQAVDRAIEITHDQFDITGDVAKFDADLKKYLISYVDSLNDTHLANIGLLGDLRDRIKDFARGDREEWWKTRKQGEAKKSESEKNDGAYLDGSMSNAEFMSKLVDNAPNSLVFNKDNNSSKNTYTISANPDFGKSSRHALIGLNADDDKYEVYTYLYNNDAMTNPRVGKSFVFKVGSDWNTFITAVKELFGFVGDYIKRGSQKESKKSESLTLKQKELKDMVRYGEAEDITGISDAEAKELRKNGIETVGVSRGVYGMNGALLRGSDGKLYAITARSSNLFYFV